MTLKDDEVITTVDGKTYTVKEIKESSRIQKSATP